MSGETVERGGGCSLPPYLETVITGKCADEPETPNWRADVAGVMQIQGRFLEAARYEVCGKVTRGYCPQCGYRELKTRIHRCELRECPECSRLEAKRLFIRIMREIKSIPALPGWTWRHLVITTKRTPYTDIRPDYLKLKIGIKRLRAFFRRKQFGGNISAVGGLQFGPKNAMAHVHIAIFSPWLNLKQIQEIMGQGTAWIKKIKSAKQFEEAVRYSANFTKSRDPVFLANIGQALKGTRRVFTWGRLYGVGKIAKKEKTDYICPMCTTKMRWEYVLEAVTAGPLAGLSPGFH